MKFDCFLGQMTSSAMEVPFCDFIQNVPQAPFMCISMWIKVNKWNYLKNPSQEFKNYFCSYNYVERLAKLENNSVGRKMAIYE